MVKAFAGIAGVFFLALGVVGWFMHDLFGIIHFDAVHNIVHLVVGAAGILAAGSEDRSVVFAKIIGFGYALLGLIGFVIPELFGLMMLEMAENVLHLAVGAIGLYIGFTALRIQTVQLKSKAG